MRLIDADALFKNNCVVFHGEDGAIVAQQMIEVINSAPTIDAVPVVRCRDCKWYEADTDWGYDETTGRRDHSKIVKKPYGECHGQNFHFTEDGFLRVGDDDFCSYGERRSNNG